MNTSETPADRGQRRSLALWLVKLGISILMLVFLFRQQDINVLEYLTRCYQAHLDGQPAPSLLPTSADSQAA